MPAATRCGIVVCRVTVLKMGAQGATEYPVNEKGVREEEEGDVQVVGDIGQIQSLEIQHTILAGSSKVACRPPPAP